MFLSPQESNFTFSSFYTNGEQCCLRPTQFQIGNNDRKSKTTKQLEQAGLSQVTRAEPVMLQFDLKVSKYQKIPLFLRIVTLYIVRCGEGLSPPPQLATKLKRQSQDYQHYSCAVNPISYREGGKVESNSGQKSRCTVP